MRNLGRDAGNIRLYWGDSTKRHHVMEAPISPVARLSVNENKTSLSTAVF